MAGKGKEADMNKKQKRNLIRIIVAAILMIVLHFAPVSGMIRFGFYLVPYLIIGYDILWKAFKGVKNRQPFDESLLMAIATLGAIILAVYEDGDYTEAIGVMLFYQIGEWFQSYAVGKSRRNISELMDIRPDYANVERENGQLEAVDPDEVEVGTIIVVKPGEKIPIDGEVVEGSSTLNTSALTGESLPREVESGDEVISGCININGLLKIRTTKEFGESTVSKILDLVENASSRKSKAEDFISKFARVYTPAVVAAAIALALVPPFVRMGFMGVPADWDVWIYRALTFLVISCPCALVISIPLSFFAGIGGASKAGVLVKGSNYLELVSKLSVLVTDKTGTLTKGNFVVEKLCPQEGISEEELLFAAASAENGSTHPIAKSILLAYQERDFAGRELLIPKETENRSGKGLIAKVQDSQILVGSGRLMEEFSIAYFEEEEESATVCHVARDGTYLGKITIADEIKESSKEAILKIKLEGVKEVVMLTGDSRPVAEEVGRALGVDQVYSELLPAGKVEKVEELINSLEKNGKQESYLAFVGDGINDAPVLSRSDVGIAMGAMGSDAAIEAADIVIMDDELTKIPRVISIGRRTVRIATENIVFALGVKILVLLLSAFGIANMWAAVFADVGVTVICIVNAMRLLGKVDRKK